MEDLKLSFTMLSTGIVNINWRYANSSNSMLTPFEVPLDLVDPRKEEVSTEYVLSDFVGLYHDGINDEVGQLHI